MTLPVTRVARGCTVMMGTDRDITGMVRRVARDGSWADVRWVQSSTGAVWDKRQPDASKLIVLVTAGGVRTRALAIPEPSSRAVYHALAESERWMMERATLDADGRRIAEQARRVLEGFKVTVTRVQSARLFAATREALTEVKPDLPLADTPSGVHADACWTTPKALCDIEAPIHPEDITTDDSKVTCPTCIEVMEWD